MGKIKQIIVVRRDLNMRKGKIAAQSAHASFKVFRDIMKSEWINEDQKKYTFSVSEKTSNWLDGEFTKICVSVNSEEELMEIYNKAKENNILSSLIIDAGHTEFNGVPTKTCCAIGPDLSENIDPITSHLKLL
jgi:PTH2 family peptidyl-tRNA hydrolase